MMLKSYEPHIGCRCSLCICGSVRYLQYESRCNVECRRDLFEVSRLRTLGIGTLLRSRGDMNMSLNKRATLSQTSTSQHHHTASLVSCRKCSSWMSERTECWSHLCTCISSSAHGNVTAFNTVGICVHVAVCVFPFHAFVGFRSGTFTNASPFLCSEHPANEDRALVYDDMVSTWRVLLLA